MWFSKKAMAANAAEPAAVGAVPAQVGGTAAAASQITTKRRGDAAEDLAMHHLLKAGLVLLDRNYRTPGRGGGEIDLVMKAQDETLVFVEVRQRSSASHGGAGGSISGIKQQRIVFAARHYLMKFRQPPPCRFDVVLVQGRHQDASGVHLDWIRAAFDAS
jgi:putative endonuclease